jgi:outer membrane protein TolC
MIKVRHYFQAYDHKIVILLLLFGSSGCYAESISFENAWRQVQQINDGLAAGRANLERSELVQEATKGLFYPRIDIKGSYTRLDEALKVNALDFNPLAAVEPGSIGAGIIDGLGGEGAFTTSVTEQSFGLAALTALWPVYTGGRVTAAQDISAARTDIAQQLFDIRRRTVFEESVRVYFAVVLAKQNLETHQEAEVGLLDHLSDARMFEEQGVISKVERLTVEVAHDRSTVATKKASRGLEIAQISLRELLHRRQNTEPTDLLFTNSSLPDVEQFVVSTIDNSPALKTLAAQDDEAQAMLKAQRGRYHPEVFLFADYNIYKDNSIVSDLIPEWQVGVGVTFTLIDRIGRSKTIGATNKARRALLNLSSETERSLTVAAQVLHKEASQALQEYSGLKSSLELANENLDLRRKAFAQGFSTSVEVVDAQVFVTAVRTERSAAAYHYVNSLARLLVLTGNTESFVDYQRSGIAQR